MCVNVKSSNGCCHLPVILYKKKNPLIKIMLYLVNIKIDSVKKDYLYRFMLA